MVDTYRYALYYVCPYIISIIQQAARWSCQCLHEEQGIPELNYGPVLHRAHRETHSGSPAARALAENLEFGRGRQRNADIPKFDLNQTLLGSANRGILHLALSPHCSDLVSAARVLGSFSNRTARPTH